MCVCVCEWLCEWKRAVFPYSKLNTTLLTTYTNNVSRQRSITSSRNISVYIVINKHCCAERETSVCEVVILSDKYRLSLRNQLNNFSRKGERAAGNEKGYLLNKIRIC